MDSRRSRALRRVKGLPREVQVGATIVLVIGFAALLAPVIAPYEPNAPNVLDSLLPPSGSHWMGTDFVGRDVFSRVLYGMRADLLIVLAVTTIGFVVGTLAGAVAAYFGRWPDVIVSRVADTAIALPFLVVVLAIVAVIGAGTLGVCLGIVAVGWAVYARIARAEMLALREQEFILATRALGYSHTRIILRHVLPNVAHSGLTYTTMDSVSNLVALAAMSYLGFGAQPPAANLGSIIASGQPYLLTAWWICTLPALLLVLLGIGIGLIGDGLTGRGLNTREG
ncbi:ABC transporter permease [Nocardioides marmoriginsengisoli]|uniref:ABC transporter permease n=1 Tax=Nocardioides marmoriginsengisoli TaxID=661483 RepID=A0A3N0CGT6_9ACTN|nr:ABC transporter permease [Nocardioides marmoriginsengisoli]RNL62529.1 ABC transporter permease [Nocardioides marmoriginsengisoli]